MNHIFTLIKNLTGFGQGHKRTNRAKKNVAASFVIKGLSILISLLLVPMTINYVNPTRYGIWITLSSIIGWFGFFDIGFGNGLRNKFAEAIAKGDKELARTYVSTTYAILTIIVVVVLVSFLLINPFINWARILNAPQEMTEELSILALIVFAFFCIQFVLKLITTILTADQKPAKASYFNLLGSIFSLSAIFIITKTTQGSLLYMGMALGLAPVLVLTASTFWFYGREYKDYSPSLKHIKFLYAKDLMSLGVKFFIIQIATLILYQTNNIIISQLYGPSEVTTYNIAFKYFGIVSMVFSIVTVPFWSAYTEAYIKNEFEWIKKTVKLLEKIWIFICIITVIMLLFSNVMYSLWIGNSIKVQFSLSLVCALYVIIVTWSSIFLSVIAGLGKITIQLYLAVIVILLNIPLAIFLARYLNLGIGGVLLATCIDYLMFAIVIPIQYKKIIGGNAIGIWNK